MKRSRVDALAWRAAALACLAGACAPYGVQESLGPVAAAVAGEWIDSSGSGGADTTRWRLSPDGHREIVTVHDGVIVRRTTDRWYSEQAESDSANGRICFVRRRGRDGASCTDARIELPARGSSQPRRMLLLAEWIRVNDEPRVLIAAPGAPSHAGR